jgi:hypothetical protein
MIENYLDGKGVGDLSGFNYYNAVQLAQRMQKEDEILERQRTEEAAEQSRRMAM